MKQFSPALRARIFRITLLGIAGVLLAFMMVSPDITPTPPQAALLAVCFVLTVVLLLAFSRLLEQDSQEAVLRSLGRIIQGILALQLVVMAFLLAAALGLFPAGSAPAYLAGELTDPRNDPGLRFLAYSGFLLSAIFPWMLFLCTRERPPLPADEE